MAFEAFWDTTGAGLRTEDGLRRTEDGVLTPGNWGLGEIETEVRTGG